MDGGASWPTRSPHGPALHHGGRRGRHHGRGAAGGGGGEGAPVAAVVVAAVGVFRSRRALLALVDPEALFPCLEASG